MTYIKPKRFPKTIRLGRYIARLDPSLGEACWRVTRNGAPVGKLHDGLYGWGRPSFTINELRWDGDALPQVLQPEARLFYDGGPAQEPAETYKDALARMAAHVERAIEWRVKQKDLVEIGRALGLRVNTAEDYHVLVPRILDAAHTLRRDFDLLAKRTP